MGKLRKGVVLAGEIVLQAWHREQLTKRVFGRQSWSWLLGGILEYWKDAEGGAGGKFQ
jgi:hypothetical protein